MKLFCPICALEQESKIQLKQHVSRYHFENSPSPGEMIRRLNNLGFGLPQDFFGDDVDFLPAPN